MRKIAILPIVIAALFSGSGLNPAGTIGPVDTAEATTSTVYWGYFTQPGFTDTPQNCIGASAPCNGVALPCTDCFLTSVTPDLEYQTVDNPPSGAGPEDTWVKAEYNNGAMLHHFVIGNYAQPDATCGNTFPINIFGDRFFASGDERGTMTLPSGYGYYIPPTGAPNNWWNLQVMIHNLGPTTKTFRIPVTFIWQPGTDPVKALSHVWLDEANCSTSQFPVPQDYSDTHADWTSGSIPSFPADDIEGTVLAIGGHVHDLGISVSAEKVQTGQWICASTAEYAMGSAFDPPAAGSPPRPNDAGHPADANPLNPGDPGYNGHIESMTACGATGVIIAPGDTIRLHTQYNPPAAVCDGSPPGCIDDVMGIMAAWIYDNCPAVSNPNQHDNDADLLGDVCDTDADGDTVLNDTDTDDDGDGALDTWEVGCGTEPLHGGRKQAERLDGIFAPTDDDADTLVNEALPAGSGGFDCDGDGYRGDGAGVGNLSEKRIYSAAGTANDQDACGGTGWPADLAPAGPSANKITLTDLSSFIAPQPKKLNTDPGDPGYDVRWDLVTGNGAGAPKDIALTDMSNITLLVPPMLGVKAFGGPVCPWAP